jgi:hypothetical protein
MGLVSEPYVITELTTAIPPREALIECGEASYGMGNRWVIDWERFYDILDTQHGWDMQDLGGKVDNAIRRIVREAVREGDIS